MWATTPRLRTRSIFAMSESRYSAERAARPAQDKPMPQPRPCALGGKCLGNRRSELRNRRLDVAAPRAASACYCKLRWTAARGTLAAMRGILAGLLVSALANAAYAQAPGAG